MLDQQANPSRSQHKIHPQAVARAVSDLAKQDAMFVLDTSCEGPAIVDWLVASDEMLNIPHLEFKQVRGYAMAKIREAIAAVVGG